jgi:hypothetical protein
MNKEYYIIQGKPDGRLLSIDGDSYAWSVSLFAASKFKTKRLAGQYILDNHINSRTVRISKITAA